MSSWIFKNKLKVVCTECGQDEFVQAEEKIRCVYCETEYHVPTESFYIQPFDLKVERKNEH